MIVYFKPDKRIFVLFSALQLSNSEFYKSLKGEQINGLTRKLKDYFKHAKPASSKRLEKYFKRMHSYFLNQWILHHGDPPLFEKTVKQWQLEAPLKLFRGFNEELGNFFKKTKIEKLFWNIYKRKALSLKTKYLDKSHRIFRKTKQYLKIKEKFSKVIIIPNLFDAVGSGYGIEIGRTVYVIFSPAGKKSDFDLIAHEFLHNLIEFTGGKKINHKILKKLKIGKQAAVYYKDKKIILTEYLIRAVTGRLLRKTQEKNYTADQIRKGFTNTDYFLKILKDYEKQHRLTFNEYINKVFGRSF